MNSFLLLWLIFLFFYYLELDVYFINPHSFLYLTLYLEREKTPKSNPSSHYSCPLLLPHY